MTSVTVSASPCAPTFLGLLSSSTILSEASVPVMSSERIQARLKERGAEDRSCLLHCEVKYFQRVRVGDSQRGHSV